MNERIRELAIQAGDSWEDTLQSDKQFLHRFAELIVLTCIRLCDQVDLVGADECIDNIKEHFGVEK